MASDLISRNSMRTSVVLYMAENAYLNDTALDVLKMIDKWLLEAESVDAEPVRHGCIYCSGDCVEYQHTTYAKLYMSNFFDEKRLEVEHNLCPPYAECSMKNLPVRSVFKINYCPNCGAKLYVKEDKLCE